MDKVRCPWCGEKMFVNLSRNTLSQITYQHKCTGCNARCPERLSEDEAYAAAMQRWEEPNRVLTFEEIMNLDPDGTTCVEDRRTGAIKVILNFEILEGFAEVLRDGGQDAVKKAHGRSYGRFSRAWLRRPTDEERAGAGWLNGDGESENG